MKRLNARYLHYLDEVSLEFTLCSNQLGQPFDFAERSKGCWQDNYAFAAH